MKRKFMAALMAAAGVLMSAALCGCGSSEKAELKFAAGSSAGTYYAYGTQLAELVSSDMKLNVRETAGSAANLRLLEEGFVDVAVAQSDIIDYNVSSHSNYSAVASLYTEAVQIVVRGDYDINSVEDLEMVSISVGEEDSGTVTNAEQILNVYGMSFDDVVIHYMSFSESADAMRTGTIMGFFVTAGAPTAAIAELAEDMDIKILSIDQEHMDIIQKMYGGYVSCRIPAGTYKGQNEEVSTLGVKAVLLAGNSVSEETIKTLTEDLFKNAEKLGSYTVTDGAMTVQSAAEGISIPFHKGAASYFESQGVSVSVSDAEDTASGGVNAGQDD